MCTTQRKFHLVNKITAKKFQELAYLDLFHRLGENFLKMQKVRAIHGSDFAMVESRAEAASPAGYLQSLRRADVVYLLLTFFIDEWLCDRVEDHASDAPTHNKSGKTMIHMFL